MKIIAFLFLLFPLAATAQINLRADRPDLPEEVWKIRQYQRIKDLSQRRDAAGAINMDWARWQAWEKIKDAGYKKTSQVNPWENLGPHTKSGRIISIAFHPTDSNIIYAGSASGGLWRSNDYGKTWNPLTDVYPSMGVGAIAVNRKNPKSIIIATGEGYAFDGEFTSGFGILISYDEGLTWSFTNVAANLSSGFAGMDIIWNSNDTNRVCVATSFGIYYSNDGGKNYTYVLDRMPSRMIQDPKNPDTLYLAARYYSATYPGGFYRSYNGGQSWVLVTSTGLPSLTSMGYASIAVHPVYNNIIYLNISKSSVNGLGPMEGLYKSDDFGNTFTKIITSVDIHCYQPPYSNICQGWYDNTIIISPSDTNTIIAGGTRFWKSTDGGLNWINCDLDSSGTAYAVHPDHHQTLFHPLTKHLFDCNDGGIDYSADMGTNWTSISDGLITHQFYNIAFAETDAEVVIGGAQDVGLFSSTKSLTTKNWEQEFSGDAFGCAIDHQNKNTWYATLYLNLQRIKSSDAGANWSQINSGTSATDQWRMPMELHPTDNLTLLSSDNDFMYKTINGGISWQQVSNIGNIGSFEFDKVNPNIVYASELFGSAIYRSMNGGNQWFQMANSPGSPITKLSTDPLNVGVVYAAIGSFAAQNQVFVSVDTGKTWTNISANLPSIPANTIAINPWNNSDIYAGTDLGVWVSEDAGASWSSFNEGLPYVVVEDIHFYKGDSTIRIGTYGRGYWRTKALDAGNSSIDEEQQNNLLSVKLNPNPVKAGSDFSVKLFIGTEKNNQVELRMYDPLGRLVQKKSVTAAKGMNVLMIKAPLQAGLYLITANHFNRNYCYKISVID